jgi:hypothetical protein
LTIKSATGPKAKKQKPASLALKAGFSFALAVAEVLFRARKLNIKSA